MAHVWGEGGVKSRRRVDLSNLETQVKQKAKVEIRVKGIFLKVS